MRIIVNPDVELVKTIREKLKANGGYCPCRLTQTEETRCMCQEFKNQLSGECHCGLYIKVDDAE